MVVETHTDAATHRKWLAQSLNGRGINVADHPFNAVGDGVVNDTQAFTDALATVSSNFVLNLSPGATYLVDQIDIDNKSDFVINGNGATIQLNHNASTPPDAIYELAGCNNFKIINHNFIGTSDTVATYTNDHKGLDIKSSSFGIISGNNFIKFVSFGIFAQSLTGGTLTEGLLIKDNIFSDFPYDSTTAFQCGVLLSSDAEYSTVVNNWFFRIPSAVRLDDAANSEVSSNMIMDLNGSNWVGAALVVDRAAVYAEPNSNSGKITISNNHINHNENDQIGIIVKGDAAKPQNAFRIVNNDMLVNGALNVGYGLIMYDAPSSIVTGNHIRPSGNVSGHAAARFNDCDNLIFNDNYIKGGDYSVVINSCADIRYGSNYLESSTSGDIQFSSSTAIPSNRAVALRVSSAGAAGTPYDAGSSVWAPTNPATGRYTITHNLSSNNYSVSVMVDNLAVPVERWFSIVRGTNTFDIYVTDGAGTATNENLLITVVLGKGLAANFINES